MVAPFTHSRTCMSHWDHDPIVQGCTYQDTKDSSAPKTRTQPKNLSTTKTAN
jgi:hypothetical protein